MNNGVNTKVLVGGIAEGETAKKLLNSLEKTEDKSFDKHIITYIDFLGMKEKMRDQNMCYDILHIIQFLLANTKNVAKAIHYTNKIEEFNLKVFSDNIVIAQKINEESVGDQIIGMLNLVWSLQFWALAQFGLFLRGGITIGELYIDKDIVWGKGLIDAYNLENNVAYYPRVLVSKSIIDKYSENKHKTLEIKAFIDTDSDGMWFVDYMSACVHLEILPQASVSIKDTVQEYKDANERIKQKINWTISYFNKYCNSLKNRIDYNECYIELI